MPSTIVFPSGAKEEGPARSSRSADYGLKLGSGVGMYKWDGKERKNVAVFANYKARPHRLNARERR